MPVFTYRGTNRAGATVSGVAVLLEIASLAGRDRLAGRSLHVLLTV